MAKNSSNLVRPRTTIQDTTLSTNPHHNRKRQQHSLQVLFLCGTCMFLVILCICLIVTLVLVSHSLSNGTLLMSICGNTNNTNNNNRTTLPKVENYWSKLFDFATTKVFNNTNALVNSIIGGESGANSEKINPNLSGGDNTQFNLNHNNRTMTTQKISKIVEQLSWRLPQEIKPKFYNLHLHPNLSEKRFTGNVSIEVIVMKPLPFIAVHSKLLNVTSTNLVKNIIGGGNVSIPIANTFDYPKYEYWITELEKPLDVGEYTLSLAFNGSLVDRIVGFYQSSYKDVERNVTRYIATSKFEPTYARQAFPCFDEPSMKAKFEINVVRPLGDGYSALSNMNEESVENDISAQTSTVHFAASVPMSTYLACFIVSDFNFKNRIINVEEKIGKKFELRVFATPAQVDKVEFALDTAANVTQYFIDYFEIEYPLPKLDLVAIPDFVSGAMEHWGLVTFRETALLFDKTSSSTANKHRVAQVVAHELAHMWFGNLVTMSWWNELWLNEGFATYLQYKGMDHAYPEWHVLDQFITETLHDVMNLDATLAAHPIVQVAESPDQITELFDAITYSKGASVIRMLADFVGEEKFRKSVTNYLNAHKYGNAVTDDLLEQIEQIDDSNKDVKHIMSTWTKQSGLPVVMVTKISPTEYLLTQKRFFSNPANEGVKLNDSEFNYRWTIPLTYTTSSNPNELKREWFNHIDLQKKITVSEEDKWIKLNKGQVGYYRVNYAKDEWKTLSSVLLSELQTFSVADRAHLLNDAFSLAEATQLNYGVALDLTRYLNQENDYVPWAVASTKLTGIRKLLSDTDNYYKFLKYARNLIDAPYKMVGWDVDDDESKKQLRVTILGFACSVGHDDCIEEAGKRFSSWLSDPSQRPNADLRSIVYTYGMVANGNEKNWDAVWKLFTTETDAQEKVKLMSSLAAVRDPNLLKRFIGLAWDEKNVRGQDYFGCLTNIAANPVGEIVVWDFVRENWQKLIDRFGLNERYLGRLIPSITSRFSSELKLHDLKEFFANYPDAGAGATARKEAIQKIEYNIQWLKNNEQKVANWLNDNEKNDKWEKA